MTSNGKRCAACADARPDTVACDVCGHGFTPTVARQKRCSAACARIAASRYMGAYMVHRYHSNPVVRDQMIAAAHARRAGTGSPLLLLSYLIKRDRGRCGICRKRVAALRGPMRPSIDHIVPLSKGGGHELANVQLAHYQCNLRKGNRGHGEQLMLIG